MDFLRKSHISRGWPGSQPIDIETECPCPKEPCGHIAYARIDPTCDQHPLQHGKTIRSSHLAGLCPGNFKKAATS